LLCFDVFKLHATNCNLLLDQFSTIIHSRPTSTISNKVEMHTKVNHSSWNGYVVNSTFTRVDIKWGALWRIYKWRMNQRPKNDFFFCQEVGRFFDLGNLIVSIEMNEVIRIDLQIA
jgi:hypothetical protein